MCITISGQLSSLIAMFAIHDDLHTCTRNALEWLSCQHRYPLQFDHLNIQAGWKRV